MTDNIEPRTGVTLVAIGGGVLCLFHIVYLVGLTGTGFVEYTTLFTIAVWLALIAVLLVNVTLLRSRRDQTFGRWRFGLMLVSLVASAIMLAPLLYVILDLGRAQP